MLITIASMAACSSSSDGTAVPTATDPAATTVPALLQTQADALTVSVPFDADHGALVLVDGPAPDGMGNSGAEDVLTRAMARMGFELRRPYELLSGRVSLVSGNGTPPLAGVPAWVMIYPGFAASCGASPMPPSWDYGPAPAGASGVHAIIVTSPDPNSAIVYYGVGTETCSGLRSEPVVEDDSLRMGA